MKNKAALNVPSLSAVSETYRALEANLDSLNNSLAEKLKARTEISEKLRGQNRSRAQAERDRRIAQLVGDGAVIEAPDDQAALVLLDQEIGDIRAAIVVVQSKIAQERIIASKAVCERVRPAYSAAVRKVCDALIVLDEASANYQRIVNDLTANNIAFSGNLRPMGLKQVIGRPFDPDGRVASYIKEAAEYGLVPASTLPREYLK